MLCFGTAHHASVILSLSKDLTDACKRIRIAHRSSLFYLCSLNRSSRWAHTFPLMKSMQKSRQNNHSQHTTHRTPGILPCQPAWKDKSLFNIIMIMSKVEFTSHFFSSIPQFCIELQNHPQYP